MGRANSSGGGQSSLGYLFGDLEPTNKPQAVQSPAKPANNGLSQKNDAASKPIDPKIPAGAQGNLTNNYLRADGQNCGNFITDRPSTKVHSAPGGGSSLDYLFGGNDKGN